MFIDLPYLIDGDVKITEMIPIVTYIAKTYGQEDMLGRGTEDQTRVDMFMWSLDVIMKKLIRATCPNMSPEEAEREKLELWNLHVK